MLPLLLLLGLGLEALVSFVPQMLTTLLLNERLVRPPRVRFVLLVSSLLLLYLVLTPQLTGALQEAVHHLDELL
ncbi:hypothetical protein PF002_g11665 [Phytophthora fragariae]|uniref:Uncharacterized protein n=1 Tax=Phytophthora fragariae TaxID=53985 RepID=A0A6A3ZDV8_9STRA|nr:hypothetical protein PF003_g6978 [Phytophthora fragariae]KAE9234946.1 hypothetical protein PF002_g11665 [Phytophthora fragariae]